LVYRTTTDAYVNVQQTGRLHKAGRRAPLTKKYVPAREFADTGLNSIFREFFPKTSRVLGKIPGKAV
jgi:hypothetical protein